MKILMLNFCRRNEGTFFRSYAWSKYLVRAGHPVTIACVSNKRKLKGNVYYDQGVRILETPNLFDGRIIMQRLSGTWGWGPLDIISRIREILSGNYDIVHTFEHFPNVVAPVYLAPKKKLQIVINDCCDNFFEGGFRDHYQYRLSFLYKRLGFPLRKLMDFVGKDQSVRSNGITVISTFLLERAKSFGINGDKIFLIPGSVDVNQVRPIQKEIARENVGLRKDCKIVAFLGSGFDLDLALDAFSLVLRENLHIYLLIIGKKNILIQRKISELNLRDRVIETGWCSNEKLNFYLCSADAFLLPMKNNPVNQARWSNKIGEYMAAGRPTICTRVGDVAELIEIEKIGLVSEPSCEDFAMKILVILKNIDLSLQMGKDARKVAEEKFSLDVQGSKLESIYKTLLN